MTNKPRVALIYDFDGTLSPCNMQEYDFLKDIGIKDKKDFWEEVDGLVKNHNASNILCYMKLMIDKSRAAGKSIRRNAFVEYGKSVELYNGVEEWFDVVEELARKYNVIVEHYINSSGLKEMIEGTRIASKFKQIYACSFLYNVDGVAEWPAVAVDFTTKTQFLFMINKGIQNISENYRVNEYKEESERPVPFKHMIYFGDGETDVPCMRMVKNYGGNSIAIYRPRNKAKKELAKKLIQENRVNFACEADYTKGKEIYNIVESILSQIKSNFDFNQLEKKNQGKLV
ncbi:MAG: haloacid dehalogenase-like hydrolase [Bacteroidales bacterium]|nr:haloacid dehalogenase-like hydrolase [Bacteroidales bacterium]